MENISALGIVEMHRDVMVDVAARMLEEGRHIPSSFTLKVMATLTAVRTEMETVCLIGKLMLIFSR